MAILLVSVEKVFFLVFIDYALNIENDEKTRKVKKVEKGWACINIQKKMCWTKSLLYRQECMSILLVVEFGCVVYMI